MTEAQGWDEYINNFLKASQVPSEDTGFICIKVEDHEGKIRLTLEFNSSEYIFDLNKTNAVALKEAGIPHPKMTVGKKIFFKKVNVQNPSTKKEVEGLRIKKVE